MSKKGKQKEVMEDDRDDDVQIDISLKSFINDQIEALQTALVAPEQEELDCTDKEHRGVEKAVKTIDAALRANRKRRFNKATVQAVIEQIEYLRASERGKAKIVRLDENDKLFVDRDDWLEDLPPNWPIQTEIDQAGQEKEIDQAKLQEYSKLYKAVQATRQNKHILTQKTEHYAMMEDILKRQLEE
ncbi:hypothetical protein P389DRAFT_197417 [Cystobasidium minutum MCA 4210]|uniref:uncharacterized protein n=1 Tax=Cystobasidium minutum MCA 4210 TaxID=1397322 RepID=UPI0034CDBF57|eukprot:jgi/Rhomi1/197417/gm1.5631_g